MSRWDDRAEERLAAQKFSDEAGPCPNCGAPATVDTLDISTFTALKFLPGTAWCSARCDESEPEKYLAAVRARK